MDLSNCKPHENGIALINWIYFLSGSCVYGHMSEISYIASTVSVTGWILAGLYQITLTFRSKRAAGFSALFLLSWVIGDITNVIGCYYTDQMTFQKVLSTSSLLLDGTMLLQYFYYSSLYPEIGSEVEVDDDIRGCDYDKGGSSVTVRCKSDTPPPILSMLEGSVDDANNANVSSRSSSNPPSPLTTILIASAFAARGATAAPLSAATAGTPLFDTHTVGTVCAWICQTLYTVSPLPQIIKNFRHRSTGGVSMALFLADMIGNFGYSMSILAASRGILDPLERSAFLREERPYLAGTTTTFLLELALLWQYVHYGTTSAPSPPVTSTIYYEGESLSPLSSAGSHQETTQLLNHSNSPKKGMVNYSTVAV